jgi:UDP:flavonoid glycosyltransferase YjiC (YdhE family)
MSLSHILVCLVPMPGHMNPLLAVAQHLSSVGHNVTILTAGVFTDKVIAASVDFGRRSQPDTTPEGLLQNKEENRRFEAAFQPATDHINEVLARCGAPPMPRLVFDCICVLPDLFLQCTGEAFELL